MNEQDSQELDDDMLHALNSLLGIVRHTYAFENEPEKKQRQEERNKEAVAKYKKKFQAYVTTRVKEAERLARIDELLALDTSEIANQSMKKMQIRIKGRIEALTATTNGKED